MHIRRRRKVQIPHIAQRGEDPEHAGVVPDAALLELVDGHVELDPLERGVLPHELGHRGEQLRVVDELAHRRVDCEAELAQVREERRGSGGRVPRGWRGEARGELRGGVALEDEAEAEGDQLGALVEDVLDRGRAGAECADEVQVRERAEGDEGGGEGPLAGGEVELAER